MYSKKRSTKQTHRHRFNKRNKNGSRSQTEPSDHNSQQQQQQQITQIPSNESVPQLKGFYYDPERGRYFRIQKGTKPPSLESSTPTPSSPPIVPKISKAEKSSLSSILFKRETSIIQSRASVRELSECLVTQLKPIKRFGTPVGQHDDLQLKSDSDSHHILFHERRFVGVYDLARNFPSKADIQTLDFVDMWSSNTYEISSLRWGHSSLISVSLLGHENVTGQICLLNKDMELLCNRQLRNGSLWTAEWDPSGKSIGLGVTNGSRLFDLETLTIMQHMSTRSDVFCQSFNPTGTEMMSGLRSGELVLMDLRSPRRSYEIVPHLIHSSSVLNVKMVDDDVTILAGYRDGSIWSWDRRMRRKIFSTEPIDSKSYAPRFFTDQSNTLLYGGQEKRLMVWSLKTGAVVHHIDFDERVHSLCGTGTVPWVILGQKSDLVVCALSLDHL